MFLEEHFQTLHSETFHPHSKFFQIFFSGAVFFVSTVAFQLGFFHYDDVDVTDFFELRLSSQLKNAVACLQYPSDATQSLHLASTIFSSISSTMAVTRYGLEETLCCGVIRPATSH